MTKFIITSTDPRGNRFFYAGAGRWSDERPDALECVTPRSARNVLAAGVGRWLDNRTWQRAVVEQED